MNFIREHITDFAALAGVALITAGVAMINGPLAYIVAGAALVAVGVIGSRRP
jgi:apolipoprotein N-acyltransferase